jgi:hypothetical protein
MVEASDATVSPSDPSGETGEKSIGDACSLTVRSCFRTGELAEGEVSILGSIECRVGRAGSVLAREGAAKYGFAGEPSRMGFISP